MHHSLLAKKICMLLCIAMIAISTIAPAAATKHAQPNPCAFSESMRDVHTSFIKISETIRGADITDVRLHHTSRSAPYRQVERAWAYVTEHNDPLLDHLTDLQIALDTANDDDKKLAALDLISAYQNALTQMYDYAHLVTAYERTENALSKFYSRRAKGYIQWGSGANFGVVGDVTRTGGDNATRDLLTEKSTLFTDALLSIKLPEYRYARFCHTTFPDDVFMLVGDAAQ
jgi:hypothetical protein